MKFQILHESSGRMRVRMHQKRMTLRQADILEAYLQSVCGISRAVVHERTSCAIINYTLPRGEVISRISSFSYAAAEHLAPEHSGRALNRTYEEKLVGMTIFKAVRSLFFPAPFRACLLYTSSPGFRPYVDYDGRRGKRRGHSDCHRRTECKSR